MRKGVDQWKPGRMITRLMTSESSSEEAGHKGPLSADLPIPLPPLINYHCYYGEPTRIALRTALLNKQTAGQLQIGSSCREKILL